MPLKTIVKVSRISNLSDARYCAGMGVDMLGFQVIPDVDGYITPELYQDIRGWISGPRITAELYGLSDPAHLDKIIQQYAPDYIELTLSEYIAFSGFLTLPCIVYHPRVAEVASVLQDARIHYWLTDENSTCEEIGTAVAPVLKKVSTLESVEQTLAESCFKGVVLEGPAELRPGVTDAQLGTILEALEVD